MVQSVELLFDNEVDRAIRAEWRRLSIAGLPSQNRVRAESNRPHITLAVASAIPPGIEGELRSRVTGEPLPVRLGGVVVFGGRQMTMSRLVVPTADLLALQREVYELVANCPGIPLHIRPGEWTPHVTLARRVPAADLGSAVVVTHAANHDLEGTTAGIRRWDGDAKREWRVV